MAGAFRVTPREGPAIEILIVGASARAAAWSALRAGLRPLAADLFADRDLTAIAATRSLERSRYPWSGLDLARAHKKVPALYSGALENHPEFLEALASDRPLWGNSGAVVRAVRDPFRLNALLHEAGLLSPRVAVSREQTDRRVRWLIKPLRSAGGLGVHFDDGRPLRPTHYLQEFIEGPSLGAIFVSRPEDIVFLGASRMLLEPGRFAYRGSVGPLALHGPFLEALLRLGERIARGFGLKGLFGVDCVERDGRPWPVEVNPRYTASVEVLELATGRSALSEHRAAFDPTGRSFQGPPAGMVAKEVLRAGRDFAFPCLDWAPPGPNDAWKVPEVADLPHEGEPFRRGDPVLTVFGEGRLVEEAVTQLEARRSQWAARLGWRLDHDVDQAHLRGPCARHHV